MVATHRIADCVGEPLALFKNATLGDFRRLAIFGDFRIMRGERMGYMRYKCAYVKGLVNDCKRKDGGCARKFLVGRRVWVEVVVAHRVRVLDARARVAGACERDGRKRGLITRLPVGLEVACAR